VADVVTVSPYIDDEIVGEPGFMFRLSLPVYVDGDVPDEVGLAIGRAAGRIYNVTVDGQEDPDEDGEDSRVEWALGPFIVEGGLTMLFDTDGYGCTPEMLQAMIRIFTEELAMAGFPIEISGTGFPHDAMPPVWKSSDGRE
jgi:hypothetical protein